MRLHVDRARDLAGSQNLQTTFQLLDDSEFLQPVHVELVALEPFERREINHHKFLAENVGKAALGQTAMQRHLAAFEATHQAVAADRTGALGASTRILSAAGTHALADAALFLDLPLRRSNVT
jgi:hypothetical protein